jgi:signal transduction histidine kinase
MRLTTAFQQTASPFNDETILRRDILRALLIVTLVAAILYLGLGSVGGLRSLLLPWDAIGLLVVSLLIGSAIWRPNPSPRTISLGASWVLALASQPIIYFSQTYGLQSPLNALFVFSIIAAALLIGLWFIQWWTLGLCAWLGLVAWGQLNGYWASQYPLTTAEAIAYISLWWVVLGGTGGLAAFFANYLERSLHSSQSQTAALTQLTEALAIFARQFKARFVNLFFNDNHQLQLHLAHVNGQIVTPTLADGAPAPVTASESPIWQELDRDHKLILINNPAVDSRLLNRESIVAQKIQTLLYIPLLLQNTLIGFVSINSTEPRRYQPEELSLARALAQQITLAVQLTRLAEQSQQTAVIDERNRLAREIHDTLAQGFTGIVIQLEAAEDALTDSPQATATHLNRARQLARTSLAEARRSVRALRPAVLDHKPFAQALRDSVQALTLDSGLAIEINLPVDLPALGSDTETELLRLVQEAVTNVLKHAQATSLTLTLTQHSNTATLTITDNGQGFDPSQSTSGFGLIGIKERATRLNAQLSIDSIPSRGTTISLRLPTSNF